MSGSPYIIRNYRPDDFGNYVQMHIEAEKLKPTGRYVSLQVLAESLARPNHAPEQDLFIAETAGKIAGYIDVTPELGIERVVIECLVHPEHRRNGLATGLFQYARRRARELRARVAHVNIAEDNVAAKNLLSKLGFRFARRFLQLRLHLSQAHLPEGEHTLICRHLQHGEEDKLTQLQNRCFSGTWGYNFNTVDEIIYRTNLSGCSPKDVILASDEGKPVGYCWTTTGLKENAATGTRTGNIYMLGVDPDYRGRGIGRLLLLAGLAHLKSKGLEVAELAVDSHNKTACALYESIGFEAAATTLWYERTLD